MRDLDELGAERVLVVGAHPDDAEFSAGGTLARLSDAGTDVALVVCTDGARGGRDVEDVAQVRREEQAGAAKALGLHDVVQLDHPDGGLVCDDRLRGELVRAIRSVRPDVVLTHDPTTLWRTFGSRTFLGHTDHRAAGQATLDALYPRARNPNFFTEQLSDDGLDLWYPRELWLFDTQEADTKVDITPTLERKLDALRLHESQAHSGGGLVEAARAVAARVGTPNQPAESFRVLRLS